MCQAWNLRSADLAFDQRLACSDQNWHSGRLAREDVERGIKDEDLRLNKGWCTLKPGTTHSFDRRTSVLCQPQTRRLKQVFKLSAPSFGHKSCSHSEI
jgi:hypothetical protein